jgi:hypothetical protein
MLLEMNASARRMRNEIKKESTQLILIIRLFLVFIKIGN